MGEKFSSVTQDFANLFAFAQRSHCGLAILRQKTSTAQVLWAPYENKENPGLHHRKGRFQYKEFAGVRAGL